MNEKLQLYYDHISYKIWLVQFPLVCDVINLIKQLLYYHGIKRTIKPLEIGRLAIRKLNYINEQGIVFYIHYGSYKTSNRYKINTLVYYGKFLIHIFYQYINIDDRNNVVELGIEFSKSSYDPSHIKSNLKFNVNTWTKFDYGVNFTN